VIGLIYHTKAVIFQGVSARGVDIQRSIKQPQRLRIITDNHYSWKFQIVARKNCSFGNAINLGCGEQVITGL
jgi:hypothetical protein